MQILPLEDQADQTDLGAEFHLLMSAPANGVSCRNWGLVRRARSCPTAPPDDQDEPGNQGFMRPEDPTRGQMEDAGEDAAGASGKRVQACELSALSKQRRTGYWIDAEYLHLFLKVGLTRWQEFEHGIHESATHRYDLRSTGSVSRSPGTLSSMRSSGSNPHTWLAFFFFVKAMRPSHSPDAILI